MVSRTFYTISSVISFFFIALYVLSFGSDMGLQTSKSSTPSLRSTSNQITQEISSLTCSNICNLSCKEEFEYSIDREYPPQSLTTCIPVCMAICTRTRIKTQLTHSSDVMMCHACSSGLEIGCTSRSTLDESEGKFIQDELSTCIDIYEAVICDNVCDKITQDDINKFTSSIIDMH